MTTAGQAVTAKFDIPPDFDWYDFYLYLMEQGLDIDAKKRVRPEKLLTEEQEKERIRALKAIPRCDICGLELKDTVRKKISFRCYHCWYSFNSSKSLNMQASYKSTKHLLSY